MKLRLQTVALVKSDKRIKTSYILMLEERQGKDCTPEYVK